MKLNNTQKTIIGFIAGLGVIYIVKKIFFKNKNKDSLEAYLNEPVVEIPNNK